MTEVEGRLENGKKSYLKYENNNIEIDIEKGFIKKTRAPIANFSIQDINSIELEEKEKNIRNYKLIINYLEKEEIIFISQEQLNDIKNEIEEDYEKHINKIEAIKADYYNTREKHLMNISLNLDFCNTLFKILESSNGLIEWDKINGYFHQLELICSDINLMGDSKIYNVSLDNLRDLINDRLIPEILNEVYELLETLFRTSIQMSENKVDFFNEKYHRLFILTLFRSWDKKLSKSTLIDPLERNFLDNDIDTIKKYLLREDIEITETEYGKAINYLNYWIDLLIRVPFKKDYLDNKKRGF